MARLIDRIARPSGPEAQRHDLSMTSFMTSYAMKPGTESLQASFASYVADGYARNGIVFAVILARLSLFSEAEFKFRGASKQLFGTQALRVLENPWPGGTTGDLLARMEQDASLAGNAFIRKAAPDLLERLRPDLVDIVKVEHFSGALEVVGYMYHRDGRGTSTEPDYYTVDEVAHWAPVPDPLSHTRGMSWLTPVVREIDSDVAMTEHKQAFFENAATPNMLIKYPVSLTSEAAEVLSRRIAARHGGPSNAWRTMVIDQGADVTMIGNSFEQMSFAAVQAAGENRIAAAAGVPGIVVGLKEGLDAASYSNYAQAMRRFADITMRPNWRSACGALSKLVDVPLGARLWYDTTDIAALREGEGERAKTAHTMAVAAGELIRAGFDPATVGPALIAGDFNLLSHTGAIPTALYPEGKAPASGGSPA